jgi:predicted kinase
MTRLHFVVGLPRSGKSTYCDHWVRQAGGCPRAVVGGDDFRHAVYGSAFRREAESLVFAAMDTTCRALLRRGFEVIVDETHTTEESLRRVLRIDPDAVPHWLDVPIEVCEERARSTGKDFLVAPIRLMAGQLAQLRERLPETLRRLRDEVRVRHAADITL